MVDRLEDAKLNVFVEAHKDGATAEVGPSELYL